MSVNSKARRQSGFLINPIAVIERLVGGLD